MVFHSSSNISSRDLREISDGSKVEFKIKAIKVGIKFLTYEWVDNYHGWITDKNNIST